MRRSKTLEAKSKLALISTFRSAFLFGLTFMGGIYFAHRYHEADRRIDERRMLVESTRRVALEADRRMGSRLDQLRRAAADFLPPLIQGGARAALPTGVEALWVGTWPEGAMAPEWLGASITNSGTRVKGPELSEKAWGQIRETRDQGYSVLIHEGSPGRSALWLGIPVSLQEGHRIREVVLARITPSYLLLGGEDLKAQRDSLSRMEFGIQERGAQSEPVRSAASKISIVSQSIPALEITGILRGDSVWQTRMEIERNGLWFLLISALVFWVGGLLWATLGKAVRNGEWISDLPASSGRGTPSSETPRVPGRSSGGTGQFPSRGETERTITREIKAGMEVFGGISESARSKIERKEVAVLHGRLVEPELWACEGRVSPQEVADTVFEILAGVREALQAEGLTPEIRLFEEGAFTVFFEIWGEGQGGFAAPLKAVLAIRRAVARINGLRKTDGHREVRVMMGLRTGVLVRDARALPVRYSGVAQREAQDLARAAGMLGVDCLISPMGDSSRGEPLNQLGQDFILRPYSTGRFSAQAGGECVNLMIVEGTRFKDEQGVEREVLQQNGLKFDAHPISGAGPSLAPHGEPPLLKLEFLEVISREESASNVISIQALKDAKSEKQDKLSASTPDSPDRKSEAS